MLERVALLGPTNRELVKMTAALNPQTGLEVVGPAPSSRSWWDHEPHVAGWRHLGLAIHFNVRPYSELDFSLYDLLIETLEPLSIEPTWTHHCHRYECPTIVNAGSTKTPFPTIPACYFDKIRSLPILLETSAYTADWETCGFSDLNPLTGLAGNSSFSHENYEQVVYRAITIWNERHHNKRDYRFRPYVMSHFKTQSF
jgi:hypothetical protein